MHLEILVEEPSVEIVLRSLIPKIVGEVTTFKIHAYQGKRDLLEKLPDRLKGYRQWLPSDWRIVVLIDEDREDCEALKQKMELAAQRVGLTTKSISPQAFQVVNRIVVEELEAWYFGDVDALTAAYPRVPSTLARKAKFRDPDHIAGGTWEQLERVLKRAGYYTTGMPKLEVARKVAHHMNPEQNHSPSFRVFADTLAAMSRGHAGNDGQYSETTGSLNGPGERDQ